MGSWAPSSRGSTRHLSSAGVVPERRHKQTDSNTHRQIQTHTETHTPNGRFPSPQAPTSHPETAVPPAEESRTSQGSQGLSSTQARHPSSLPAQGGLSLWGGHRARMGQSPSTGQGSSNAE